jgi:hypothetical protein
VTIDMFDHVSVHRSPLKRGHAHEALGDIVAPPDKNWVVARFVNGSRYGWPMRWIAEKLMRMSMGAPPALGGLGSDDTAPVAFFSESDALDVAGTAKFSIAVDRPAPLALVTWRVLLFSHFDLSAAETYRGNDHDSAVKALGLASLAVLRQRGIYVKAIMEGVVDGEALR